VQYPETQIQNMPDLKAIPLRSANGAESTRLDMVSQVSRFLSPTEVDHYQLRRIIDIYVQTKGEDLSGVANAIDRIIDKAKPPKGINISLRGMVQGMRASFSSFGLGLCMSVVLLFLVITAQFQSFIDPVLILLALPPGLTGVLLTLWLTGTTLNVMSLMGIVMMVGISVSDSILIVEFTKRLRGEGMAVREAVATAARVRLRPVLMTSLATVIGLLPMALKLGEGSESYAPLARAICGGVTVSAMLTVFVVPAAYVFVYGRKEAK
jgi:multidrug efflux pump subunit AcrB